jgi:two-component system, LuxR family, sensor kinase FixL
MAGVPPLRVLIIEDDPDTQENLRDILELDEHRVDTAATTRTALGPRNWADYSAIILDRRLPDGNAEELLPRLRELAPDAAVLIVTGYADLDGAIAALRLGAADYILKPINAEALRASLARIAERRHLALAKERTEAAFRTLVEAAPCAIVILRPDCGITYFSPFAEKCTGHTAAEVLNKDYLSILTPELRSQQAMQQQIEQVLAGKPMRGFENSVRCKDGSFCWMVWNADLLPDYEGTPAILAVGQDITTLKQAQEQALQSERLATIGQMVAGLAHESRNALQLIQASLEMLALEVEDRPAALEEIAAIQAAEDRLHRLFEDIRGYAAPIHLQLDVYDLSTVWRRVWGQMMPQRNGRTADLVERIRGLDLACWLDLFSLERVFRNIFENSLAACRDPVEIDISCEETSLAGRPALHIRVCDNGPGLSAEQRKRIFEPFFTTKTHGTGLGMAIAKRIVEAHGGQIAIGQPRQGAEIIITLPRGPR